MTKPRRTVSGVTALAGAVLVLLPALAWLQYSWLEQIADADRERRARTLQTAATQLAQDFDAEIGRAVFALQMDPASVEQRNWSGFAQKYQVWADSAASPRVINSIYFVAAPDKGSNASAPPLRRWNTQTHTFEETPWPKELTSIRTRFIHENVSVIDLPREGRRADGRRERPNVQRMVFPPTPTGDDQSIVTPVMRITATPGTPDDPRPAPHVTLLGFTIIRFDMAALGQDVLPSLIRKHFYDDDGETEFSIAVVSRDDASKVVFESAPSAAIIASEKPDTSTSLLGPRMGQLMFMARAAGARRADDAPPPPVGPENRVGGDMVVNIVESRRNGEREATFVQRASFAGEGSWRLFVKHRAGSLEAAVSAARTRNFALSTGILALLAAAVGLILVSARRADRLARQQLEFVAAVSHELRTPVSVIGAAAGNLADGVVDEPGRVKKYGATIQTEARRLGETVERVLQLAGIAAGRAAASPTALAVAPLVDEAIAATRHEGELAGARIEVHIADDLRHAADGDGVRRVVGDAAALRSAIQNLISNAIKYGGPSPWVRVSATALPHQATRISVEDRGLGIAPEDRRHIFEPFYRGREAVARQIQGSGLGLHLVRRIVEAHGGSVSVQSEVGRGSTFTIDLPGVLDTSAGTSVPLARRVARST